jgi:hypothetical protein
VATDRRTLRWAAYEGHVREAVADEARQVAGKHDVTHDGRMPRVTARLLPRP